MRLLTDDFAWSRVAFAAALLGAVTAAVALLPEVVDWLASDRHTAAHRAARTAVGARALAAAMLALGVVLRLQAGADSFGAATFALAVTAAAAWLAGGRARVARARLGVWRPA